MEYRYVYLVMCESNIQGDHKYDIVSAHESYMDACFALAEEVKTDLQHAGWMEDCELFDMEDIEHNPIKEGSPVPDYISYFEAKDSNDAPECYESLWIMRYIIHPESTDSKNAKKSETLLFL